MTDPSTPSDDQPGPTRDPRLEIPEVLRQPIQRPDSMKPRPPSALFGGLGEVGRALSLAIDFLCITAAGGGLGYLADRWLSTSPGGLLVGLFAGFIAGTIRLVARLNAADKPKPKR